MGGVGVTRRPSVYGSALHLCQNSVDIRVVDGIGAFDDAGFADGEPAKGQVADIGFGFFAGGEPQRIA
jgi:hypothetical protein